MKYRTLGRAGLKVSELCLGCMTFGPGTGFMSANPRNMMNRMLAGGPVWG